MDEYKLTEEQVARYRARGDTVIAGVTVILAALTAGLTVLGFTSDKGFFVGAIFTFVTLCLFINAVRE